MPKKHCHHSFGYLGSYIKDEFLQGMIKKLSAIQCITIKDQPQIIQFITGWKLKQKTYPDKQQSPLK